MTETTTRKGQKATSLLDNDVSDCNSYALCSDAHPYSVHLPYVTNCLLYQHQDQGCYLGQKQIQKWTENDLLLARQRFHKSRQQHTSSKASWFWHGWWVLCTHSATWQELTALRIPRSKLTSGRLARRWKDSCMKWKLHMSSRVFLTWASINDITSGKIIFPHPKQSTRQTSWVLDDQEIEFLPVTPKSLSPPSQQLCKVVDSNFSITGTGVVLQLPKKPTLTMELDSSSHLPCNQGTQSTSVLGHGNAVNKCATTAGSQNLAIGKKLLLSWHFCCGHLSFKTTQ